VAQILNRDYEAVIFDLDGTLVDSLEDLADSMNFVLESAGLPKHDTQAYKYFVGEGMEKLVFNALPENFRDRETVKIYTEKMKEEYNRRWNIKTRPYKNIPQLLDALSRMKTHMAVLSNKPDKFTKLIVKELLPSWNFEIILGQKEGIPRKPDPAGALMIASSLSIDPGKFIYLGDSGIDMQTASNAGMFAVGALWGFRKKEELIAHGAKALIEDPLELLKL